MVATKKWVTSISCCNRTTHMKNIGTTRHGLQQDVHVVQEEQYFNGWFPKVGASCSQRSCTKWRHKTQEPCCFGDAAMFVKSYHIADESFRLACSTRGLPEAVDETGTVSSGNVSPNQGLRVRCGRMSWWWTPQKKKKMRATVRIPKTRMKVKASRSILIEWRAHCWFWFVISSVRCGCGCGPTTTPHQRGRCQGCLPSPKLEKMIKMKNVKNNKKSITNFQKCSKKKKHPLSHSEKFKKNDKK